MVLGIITIIVVSLVIIFLSISFYITIFGGGPFVPTPMEAVHKVLKAAQIKKNQYIIDIGAGDGRFLHFAEKNYGAKTLGFERDPFVFFIAKFRQYFFSWKGKIIRTNLFKQNFKKADIILCYMLPKTLGRCLPKFRKELKKGAKIISYSFQIPGLKPAKIIPKTDKIGRILIYKF